MALDDADRRTLEEIERRLQQDHPRLARSLGREPVRAPRLPAVPVVAAVLILLASFGWLAVTSGSLVPLLLALPPAAAALGTLWWQRPDGALWWQRAADPSRAGKPAPKPELSPGPPPDGPRPGGSPDRTARPVRVPATGPVRPRHRHPPDAVSWLGGRQGCATGPTR